MADHSKIEWTDASWNPVTGCTKVSPGCDHCYAETFAERWRGTPGHHFENGFDLTLRPERLDQPLRWRRPRRVFVNSMSDLFHDGVPDEFIARVFAVMALAPQHTFQLLTKRHGRMRAVLRDECRCGTGHAPGVHLRSAMSWAVSMANPDRIPGLPDDAGHRVYHETAWPLPNVWLGVSVEDQKRADLRIPALLDTPAAVRWLSCEPLLGPVNLDPWRNPGDLPDPRTPADTRIDWVVVGGESGPGARPMHPDWARSLRDQCEAAGVPFFFKQWGAWVPYEPDAQPPFWTGQDGDLIDSHYLPVGLSDGEPVRGWWWPGIDEPGERDVIYMRAGKGAAGRELDGRTWDEYPEVHRAG